MKTSYNCIYLFSKLQILLSNSNEKLNKFIDNNITLLKIKNDIKHLLKPHILTALEFIKDGKPIDLFNENENEPDYDFSIVSWVDEKNTYINKKIVYDKEPPTLSLSVECDIKFILI